MATEKVFNDLSNELFENITKYFDEPRELSVLCLVSRDFYHRVVPKLYQSWSYRGLEHATESLRSFVKTLLWRPDLAAHVKTLDIREWGNCPHLEDHVGSGTQSPQIQPPRDVSDDEEDSDYEDSEDSDASSSEYSEDISESELDGNSGDKPGPLEEGEIKGILRKAAENYDIEDSEFLVNHYAAMHATEDDTLLAILISSLPNLITMFIAMTDNGEWYSTHLEDPNERFTPLSLFVKQVSENPESHILRNLETVYICSALQIGAKAHRTYELYLDYMLPFFKLKALRSLYMLTLYTSIDHLNWPRTDFGPYKKTSEVTELVLDEGELCPDDAIQVIGVPKALKSFRWSQEVKCFSQGSCYGPFHNSLGDALRDHKYTLENLDIDVRHKYCKENAHRGNPHATTESLRARYRNYRNTTEDPESHTRGPQDAILVGSLKDFANVTTLSIDATALCGHQNWSPAPVQMIEVLPPSLQTLNLRVRIQQTESTEKPHLDNTLWQDHVLDLIRRSEVKLPTLRNLGLLVMNHGWAGMRRYEQPVDEREYECFFTEIRGECERVGLKFSLAPSPDEKTCIPYFQEQTKNRNPGRDF